ncbi:hypothetical protein CRG98_035551 [Punica granatum]|uniref:Uncharacterized protein n=1 Tax=Punica granatum TaxID=22663 RepID=A0A2I0IJA3_PUNGR|nr:hypothetical protein CRG98_035551 [Punica granatum]
MRLGSVHLPGDAQRTHVRRSRHYLFTTRRSRADELPGSREIKNKKTVGRVGLGRFELDWAKRACWDLDWAALGCWAGLGRARLVSRWAGPPRSGLGHWIWTGALDPDRFATCAGPERS